jgi:hypothetical protein
VCGTVAPSYWDLKEVSLFQLAPNSLDPSAALALYVKAGSSEWLYRGCVHNGHPSDVMPLQVRCLQACCLDARRAGHMGTAEAEAQAVALQCLQLLTHCTCVVHPAMSSKPEAADVC